MLAWQARYNSKFTSANAARGTGAGVVAQAVATQNQTREINQVDPAVIFGKRKTIEQVEEGAELAPRFDANGLIPAVTTDYQSGELLMHGYMNAEALTLTIETREAHYFSRSRQAIWHKGATSGLVQKVVELMVDDDQDCVWLRVDVAGGASCHVGYRSCFYRKIPENNSSSPLTLEFTETEKVFDPEEVYKGQPNPTKL